MNINLKRGFTTLGTVFLLVLFLVVLGFSLSSASITHLQLNTHNLRETEALNLARSAVSAAISKIYKDTDHGKDRSVAASESIDLQGDHQGAYGRLSFNQAEAASLGIRYSTNNLDNTTSSLGDGRTVAGQAIHMVAEGASGQVKRRVEVVLKFRLFVQAIASSGPISSNGPLLVATLADSAVVSEDNLLPADILSNSGQQPAISLVDGTRVTGDIQTAGSVALPDGVDVWGEVRANAGLENIVTLNPQDYDPNTLGLIPEDLNDPSYPGPFLVEGAARANNNITVNGDLQMNGGLLYVNGDLTVTGKVSGLGMLISTGNVSVGQGADFTAGQKVAILSEGRVNLQGTGTQTNFFQGLIYTRQGLSANQITVIGALINDGTTADAIDLNGCRVFYDPELPTLSLSTQTFPEVIADLTAGDRGYIVTINPDGPQLEYFRYDGPSNFGAGTDPDEARRAASRQVMGTVPDTTFPIPQSLLDVSAGPGPASSVPSGPFTGPGGAITPGRGIVPETTLALAGLEQFHEDLISDIAAQLNPNHAEVMFGQVIRGFDRRDTGWMDELATARTVELLPSETLKPEDHQRVVLWKEY